MEHAVNAQPAPPNQPLLPEDWNEDNPLWHGDLYDLTRAGRFEEAVARIRTLPDTPGDNPLRLGVRWHEMTRQDSMDYDCLFNAVYYEDVSFVSAFLETLEIESCLPEESRESRKHDLFCATQIRNGEGAAGFEKRWTVLAYAANCTRSREPDLVRMLARAYPPSLIEGWAWDPASKVVVFPSLKNCFPEAYFDMEANEMVDGSEKMRWMRKNVHKFWSYSLGCEIHKCALRHMSGARSTTCRQTRKALWLMESVYNVEKGVFRLILSFFGPGAEAYDPDWAVKELVELQRAAINPGAGADLSAVVSAQQSTITALTKANAQLASANEALVRANEALTRAVAGGSGGTEARSSNRRGARALPPPPPPPPPAVVPAPRKRRKKG